MAHLLRPESKEALDTGLGQLQSFKREQLVSGRNYRVTMGGQRTGFVEFNLVVPLPAPFSLGRCNVTTEQGVLSVAKF